MGGGHKQLLGCSAVTYAPAYAEGHATAGSVWLLRRIECCRFGHDVSLISDVT